MQCKGGPHSFEGGKKIIRGQLRIQPPLYCRLISIQARFSKAQLNRDALSRQNERSRALEHASQGLLWIRPPAPQRVCVHLQRSPFSWTRLLINGGCRLQMTSSSGQQKWQKLRQVWLVYVQVRTGQSLKAEPDFISYLNSTPPPPAQPWQHRLACTALFSLLGMQTFHSSEAQSTLEGSDVSVSVS